MKKQTRFLIVGIALLLISLMQIFLLKQAHFYSLFSIGLLMIFWVSYELISRKKIFNKWPIKDKILFWILLLIASIIIDKIGLVLGYWTYPHYSSIFDDILKYSLEYTVPLFDIMLCLLIGFELFKKIRISKVLSFILSLAIFVILLGIITEFLNLQVDSWRVLAMPFTNYKIGQFFVVWQTIGFWLMAIIPLIIYKFVERKK